MDLTKDELHKVREWFDTVQDMHPAYLDNSDYALAKKIYQELDMRVPNSIEDGATNNEPDKTQQLLAAAQGVIALYDAPSWKKPSLSTADVMSVLRAAIARFDNK